jgi:hypothetical protein
LFGLSSVHESVDAEHKNHAQDDETLAATMVATSASGDPAMVFGF